MKDKILFLDFDGVLFDTMKEVYLVNRYLYLGCDFLDEIDKNNYRLYSRYKYLVYNIWMFYYYNTLIFNNEKEVEEKFKNLILKREKDKEDIFCEEFLTARRKLVLNHYDFWKNLEEPYDFFFEIKKLYESGVNIVVVSKKNKTSIMERFSYFNFKIPASFVFAREVLDKYSSKGEFMEEYMKKNDIKTAIFVDDNENNLKTTLNNPKIENILAFWGNANPKSKGFSQNEALDRIYSYLSSK